MGEIYNNGAVTANISGSVNTVPPTMPSGATQVCRSAIQGAGGGTQTLYTVTAGKTLYISSAWASVNNQANTCVATTVEIDQGGSFYAICGASAQGPAGGTIASNSCAVAFPSLVQVAATKTVRLAAAGASQSGAGGFTGYEV